MMKDTTQKIPPSYMSASETRRCNGRITDILSLFLNFSADRFDLAKTMAFAEECGLTRETALAHLIAAAFDVEADGADRAFFENYFPYMITELDAEEFRRDPYYRNVTVPCVRSGGWEMKYEELKAGEAFVRRDFIVTDDGRLIPQIGYFTEPFAYPAVLEGGREWMTLMPNETVTTAPAIEAASGKVLTYGLGLGYFAYMASEKESVSSVTVVEKSPEVIDLVTRFILPQFPQKEKIKIVCSDAFDYAEHVAPRERYDFVFSDIWRDAGDGRDLMLKMKEYEQLSPKSRYMYWIEDTINCYLDPDLWP